MIFLVNFLTNVLFGLLIIDLLTMTLVLYFLLMILTCL